MYPHSNQPAKLYKTAKTHTFDNTQEINKETKKNLPYYRPNTIIQLQYSTSHLTVLCENEFTINGTQSFKTDLKNIPPLQEDEDVSYDVESLFTNIPINETIDYILDQIYNKQRLNPICSKLIFKHS